MGEPGSAGPVVGGAAMGRPPDSGVVGRCGTLNNPGMSPSGSTIVPGVPFDGVPFDGLLFDVPGEACGGSTGRVGISSLREPASTFGAGKLFGAASDLSGLPVLLELPGCIGCLPGARSLTGSAPGLLISRGACGTVSGFFNSRGWTGMGSSLVLSGLVLLALGGAATSTGTWLFWKAMPG